MHAHAWPPMIWIGGGPGAGKSTVAQALARSLDLPLHPIDLWTYDHAARLNQAVWLVPDPARTRLAREQRLAAVKVPAGPARLERILERDAMLGTRIRRTAVAAGHPVIEVPAEPDWVAIDERVRAALRPALTGASRWGAGAELAEQRRYENRIACRQGRSWQAAVGIDALPPPLRLRMRRQRLPCDLAGHPGRVRRPSQQRRGHGRQPRVTYGRATSDLSAGHE